MKNRFTLIELLIVVAIFSLLFALLLPSLSKARRSALTSGCLSNLSNAGKASSLALLDNKQKFQDLYKGCHSSWFGSVVSHHRLSVENKQMNYYAGYRGNTIHTPEENISNGFTENQNYTIKHQAYYSGDFYLHTYLCPEDNKDGYNRKKLGSSYAVNFGLIENDNKTGRYAAIFEQPDKRILIGELAGLYYALFNGTYGWDIINHYNNPRRFNMTFLDGSARATIMLNLQRTDDYITHD